MKREREKVRRNEREREGGIRERVKGRDIERESVKGRR